MLIVALLEGTRFIAPFLPFLAPAQIAAVRELSVSVLLLVILRVLPGGIVPERIATYGMWGSWVSLRSTHPMIVHA